MAGDWKSAVRFERPEVIDRQLDREKFARWKIVCEGLPGQPCGKIWYLENMSITQVVEETQYQHELHNRRVYYRDGAQLQDRGGLPPTVQEADEG